MICDDALFDDQGSKAADGKRALKWRNYLHQKNSTIADPHRTFLTDGFFPHLQVVLHNNAFANKWIVAGDTDNCRLEKNLFNILVNGMDIMVEYSGFTGYFVDILVMSSKPHAETMDFVQLNITSTIRTFCASQEGCQGVSLREAIIRPACLRRASPLVCANRKNSQVIAVEDLEQKMGSTDKYMHSWGEVKDERGRVVLHAGEDSPKVLLDGEDTPSASGAPVPGDDGSSFPKHIFVTREDVPLINKVAAKGRLCKVVPFQFHLQCECKDGEHPVDKQPGRTFYVADSHFPLEQRFRNGLVALAALVLGAGGTVIPGLGTAGNVVGSLPLYNATPLYPPLYCDTIESLSERISGTASGNSIVTEEELRLQVEGDMINSRAGEWMNAFLNLNSGHSALRTFQDDFLLGQVEYVPSAITAWICEQHWKEGLESGILRRVL